MTYNPSSRERDPFLWELAKRRAAFKPHLLTYLFINAFLWILWYATGTRTYHNGIAWPVWPTLGWGIGLLFHYLGAYVTHGHNAIEKEYQKLQNENKNTQ